MAIGLGKIFGFDFPENFNYPYISKSITEFWRRWHMSLGTWFRDYVYIPMGGNRVKKWRWFLNILVVWALTGLWHGAAWNFVIWGLYMAFSSSLRSSFCFRYSKEQGSRAYIHDVTGYDKLRHIQRCDDVRCRSSHCRNVRGRRA